MPVRIEVILSESAHPIHKTESVITQVLFYFGSTFAHLFCFLCITLQMIILSNKF